MASEYGNATAIPLVSPSDQKYKLLRLATALAILTGSVEDENVVVLDTHVEFIYNYLKNMYDTSAGLQFFAGKSMDNNKLTEEQCQALKKQIINNSRVSFSDNKDGTPASAYMEILQYLNVAKLITEKAMEQHTSVSIDEVKGVINTLVKSQCLKTSQYGLQKTGRLNQFIAWEYANGTMEYIKNII